MNVDLPAMVCCPDAPACDGDAAASGVRRRVRVGKAWIDVVRESECVEHVLRELDAGRGGWVLTANSEHLRLMEALPAYAELAATASLTVADGMPLVWVSRIRGEPLPERVAGSDLISSLTHAAAGAGRSVFLLGGDPGTAVTVAAVLRRRDATLRVAGTLCPPRGFDRGGDGMEQAVGAVAAAAPDIVLVALPTPLQDFVIARLRTALPRAWHVGLGISFSFLSGDVSRASRWMQRAGLEWAHRMAQEPRRLVPRYLRIAPLVARLLGEAVMQRLSRRKGKMAANERE